MWVWWASKASRPLAFNCKSSEVEIYTYTHIPIYLSIDLSIYLSIYL